MEKIKFNAYKELEKIKEIGENEFIINLEDCPINQSRRIIDFFAGLTFLNGSMKKINNYEYEIKISK